MYCEESGSYLLSEPYGEGPQDVKRVQCTTSPCTGRYCRTTPPDTVTVRHRPLRIIRTECGATFYVRFNMGISSNQNGLNTVSLCRRVPASQS